MDDFLLKSPEKYNYFYDEQTTITVIFLKETQPQDPVLRQILLWKQYKNCSTIPTPTIRANKGLLH